MVSPNGVTTRTHIFMQILGRTFSRCLISRYGDMKGLVHPDKSNSANFLFLMKKQGALNTSNNRIGVEAAHLPDNGGDSTGYSTASNAFYS